MSFIYGSSLNVSVDYLPRVCVESDKVNFIYLFIFEKNNNLCYHYNSFFPDIHPFFTGLQPVSATS